MEKQLRQQIASVLGNVTAKTAPNVYDMIQSENGYKTIEDMIIRLAIENQMSVSACIPQIENMI